MGRELRLHGHLGPHIKAWQRCNAHIGRRNPSPTHTANPAQQLAAEVAAAKNSLTAQKKQVTDLLADFTNKLNLATARGDDDGAEEPEISKAQYLAHTRRLAHIRSLIWPGMSNLLKVYCDIDINNAGAHQAANADDMNELSQAYYAAEDLLAGKKLAENALDDSALSVLGAAGLNNSIASLQPFTSFPLKFEMCGI